MDINVVERDGVASVKTTVEVAAAVRNVYELVLAKQVCSSLYSTQACRDTSIRRVPGDLDVVSFATGLYTSTTFLSSFRPSPIAVLQLYPLVVPCWR